MQHGVCENFLVNVTEFSEEVTENVTYTDIKPFNDDRLSSLSEFLTLF